MNQLSPHNPPTPRLPSRRVSAILVTAMLVTGIALGALLGPGPVASLASSSRAAALARIGALLALQERTSALDQPWPSLTAAATGGAGDHSGGSHSKASVRAAAGGEPQAGAQTAGPGSSKASAPASSQTQSKTSPTPTAGSSPGANSGKGKTVKLPPIAHVWLIALSGPGFSQALAAPTAAPYLTGQLIGAGILLSAYSSLATQQFAGTATLLSGQVTAGVTTLTPACAGVVSSAGAATPSAVTPGANVGVGVASQSASATTPSAATQQSSGATPAGAAATTPCPTTEPAALQAADTFLHEVVPTIVASAPYREGGLIAITFAPAANTAPQVAYPAGTLASSVTAEGAAPGALLLSPFLRHAGTRSASTFDELAPRESVEELLASR